MVALPALMEDLVRRACATDASVEMLAPSAATVEAFLRAPAMRDADIIITVSDSVDVSRVLLERTPTARLLLIEQQDGMGYLTELRPTRSRLGPISPAELMRIIANDGTHRAAWAMLDEPMVQGSR
ncbi:MAG TPA: hypothetical protein DGD08_04655 [Gemmatimonas aurantiaca]|uniref:Uncharacterized protein n=2 Tax=Gemmatimonas aurantiaca TaxID=173480 RepID=C1ADB0_GEMAT|nr:hypothetical protein [Gemmatimonas aurantiaca]BAH40487.1 hypothetical protein GAU_3445 [Gemmatimonas aurantiaca T-27]HCT56486.1 hypothetical protein [Gemmatimonas aurantiaca]